MIPRTPCLVITACCRHGALRAAAAGLGDEPLYAGRSESLLVRRRRQRQRWRRRRRRRRRRRQRQHAAESLCLRTAPDDVQQCSDVRSGPQCFRPTRLAARPACARSSYARSSYGRPPASGQPRPASARLGPPPRPASARPVSPLTRYSHVANYRPLSAGRHAADGSNALRHADGPTDDATHGQLGKVR